MPKLNEQKILELVRAGAPCAVAVGDGSGLTLRIKPPKATWQLRYRHAGKAHWLTLGHYPACSLKEARQKATAARAGINQGIDPIADRERARIAIKEAKTLADLVADYETRVLPGLAPATQANVRRMLHKEVLPRIGALPLSLIGSGEVIGMVEDIGKRSDTVARAAFSALSIVYTHGQAKRLVAVNPCVGLKLSAILGKKPAFRPLTSLTETQLRRVLPELPKIGPRNALLVRLILATLCRKSELLKARRANVDLQAAIWHIPAPDAKNRKAFDIPLVPAVVRGFRELFELAPASDWVCPGIDPGKPMSGSTLNYALLRLKFDAHFTVHDLRRTARTHLGRLGIDVIVAERCLNHSLGGLVEIYDRGNYFEQRRQALELWAAFLLDCEVNPGNVVNLRRVG